MIFSFISGDKKVVSFQKTANHAAKKTPFYFPPSLSYILPPMTHSPSHDSSSSSPLSYYVTGPVI